MSVDRRYGVIEGLGMKAPVLVATTGSNITLSGLQTVDGVVLVDGNRVLVKDQTDQTTNGIYLAHTSAWTRDLDFDGQLDIVSGTMVTVGNAGGLNKGTLWQVSTVDPISIDGTTPSNITFTQVFTTTVTAVTAATLKNPPIDADWTVIVDSVSNAINRVTWANTKATIFTALGGLINAATSKTTPVGADSVVIQDSAASNATKQATFSNIFTNMLGVLLNAATSKTTPVGADSLLIQDSAASNVSKQLTFTNLLAYLKGQQSVLGTPVATTSGTAITFSSIPSWVKRITINFKGVGTNGTSLKQIQIGSGSITTSGYVQAAASISSGAYPVVSASATSGFIINSGAAAERMSGSIVLILENSSNNTWVASGVLGETAVVLMKLVGGYVSLSGALDRVVITTVNGTDAFAAGEINILYE